MVVRKASQRRLTPDVWARAALLAIAKGGVAAVAVESVAAELGATKGSFYWHFKNRDALVEAALGKWEQRRTESVIEDLERESSPAGRLRMLFEAVLEGGPTDRVEVALLANPEHPTGLRAVRRVAERRIRYIADQLETLGWDSKSALDRAVLLYYVYVGHLLMAQVTPQVIGGGRQHRQIELVFNALVARGPLKKPAHGLQAQGPPQLVRQRSRQPR
jgi:AcrR family transcriptional regulator